MSAEFWAIIGVGLVIIGMLATTNAHLDKINTRLQNFWEDILDQRR